MFNRSRSRLFTVLLALVSLLFMQLAVAGYTCPIGPEKATVSTQAEMPCAESMSKSMDDAQPNLCQAHCQIGQQTNHNFELPSVPGMSVVFVDFSLPDIEPVSLGVSWQLPHLTRTTSPPASIRNCCFRI